MRILGLIPARGGSKGIPGKNTKLLGGKPLINHTIEAARQSRLLSRLCISTDSEAIADCGMAQKVEVPFLRPAAFAADTSAVIDAVLHALEYFEHENIRFDAVCLLQPTCPFRPRNHIDQAVETLMRTGCESVVSVLPVPDVFNPHWVMYANKDWVTSAVPASTVTRRQDLPSAYRRSGAVYLTTVEFLRKSKKLICDRSAWVEACPAHHVNLDTPADWELAERLLESKTEIEKCCGGFYV